MADIHITWKKITMGLPKGRDYADDRFPRLRKYKNYWSTQTGESRPLCIPWPLPGFYWAHGTI